MATSTAAVQFHSADLLAGITAGASVALSLHPLDLVKVRFQVNDGSIKGIQYNSTLHAFRTIVRVEGVAGLFKGAIPGVVWAVAVVGG